LAKPGGAAGAAVSGGVKEGGVEGAKGGVEESKEGVRVKGESDSTVMTTAAVSKASEGKETKKAEGQAGKTEVEGQAGKTEVETKRTEVEGRKPAVETKKPEVETKKPEVEGKRTDGESRKAEGGEVKAGEGVTASSHNGGIFKGDFSESGKSASGTAGTFKSTSGWQDGKYYALMNNIAVGTIVKVSDGYTGKIIYAKVLGALPDMKESAGLTIRISNAAASELGEGEGRFNVAVSY
ncbi:MAG: hypothetical protein JST42_07810, partial [Bacteroidetes bacterium]|nr:hypothetical protein [Bacteroidota bacterium]